MVDNLILMMYQSLMNTENMEINRIADAVISGTTLPETKALFLAELPKDQLPYLFSAADRIRRHFFGNQVMLCGIINAKSGRCPEDCSFCSQSVHYQTGVDCYGLLDKGTILAGAAAVAATGAACYGIVTSGSSVEPGEELDQLLSVISDISATKAVSAGASLGMLSETAATKLKLAGLVTYHHNLETGRSFFPKICSTHSYESDIATIHLARKIGFRVCSGGLFGLGESMADRIELAYTLRECEVDSVPINFLDPVEGTPLAGMNQLDPATCLHIISLFRFILPDRHITVCGGRERNLRSLQSWIFRAGASGMMTGNYLTKSGCSLDEDLQMLTDLGLTVSKGVLR